MQQMRAMQAVWVLAALGRGYAAGENLQQDPYFAERSCQEFEEEMPSLSGWSMADCVSVWNAWAATVPTGIPPEYDDAEIFDRISAEQHGPGSRCLVRSIDYPDGAGSLALRHLTTWVRAK